MKRKPKTFVERFVKESIMKAMEKSGNDFKTIEQNIEEVGVVNFMKKDFVLLSCDNDDRQIGANYRIGEKTGNKYRTLPVDINLNTNTAKVYKTDGTWSQEFKIKKIELEPYGGEGK